MRFRLSAATASIILLLFASWFVPAPLNGQTHPKAMVLAWDGAVPSLVNDMLRDGKLPHLARLVNGGAYTDEVRPVFPSATAPGFASLATGAPPRATGVTGNRVPKQPRSRHTILESANGFDTPLEAEPLWEVALRSGRRVVAVHMPFGASSRGGLSFQGYSGVVSRDGVIDARISKPQLASNWINIPASAAPPLEISFHIAASRFFGLFIDAPETPRYGYDTLIIAPSRDGARRVSKLASAPAGSGTEGFWSVPVTVVAGSGEAATTYLRLFDLRPDGSDFLLYFTRPAREAASPREVVGNAPPIVRSFVGNGGTLVYGQGGFGRTIPNGGDGVAEARYLETVMFAQYQLSETMRWAADRVSWELFFAYTPFPDEAEHLWRGYLDPRLSTYRAETAQRLLPYLERVYQTCDDLLGTLLARRPPGTIVAVVSDHGMEGVDRQVAVNKALEDRGLLVFDERGRVDFTKTVAIYGGANNAFVLLNTTDRKNGTVPPERRSEVAGRVREALLGVRDGERQPISAVFDAQLEGAALGIGGEAGGDLYLDLLPGYDFDPRLRASEVAGPHEPRGAHGFHPDRPSMQTILVLNGPGVAAGRRLGRASITDFAPTLAKLLAIPVPRHATGRVLREALVAP
ncbi:MAG TPA: alkaline phosphatase family protein [Candidatus Eisenbacteria bacterium]|nr:alkaline phosphatase family protein [Candidatus Eisenbacteria bacterium]